jgi:hypothetical protein
MKRLPKIKFALLFFVASAIATAVARAQDGPPQPPPDASASAPVQSGTGLNLDMKLEDLARTEVVVPALSTPVTTAERQPSTIGHTPAAMFVITPEMIKRSDARTIPDVLHIAPGVDVARIDANTWAISIRDFNARFANKLLMEALIDLPDYETSKGLTDAQLLLIGDINGDGVINNADLQALLGLLNSGGGSSDPVPEPASLALLGLGTLAIAYRRHSRKPAVT